jgi:hypothetical protein
LSLVRPSTGYLKSHSRADGVLSGRLCGAGEFDPY